MATIADVARQAGVSIATVSRVLSPGAAPHPVNVDTAQRVRDAALALDFVPSALARGLASRRSGLVGLLVRDLADPHYPRIARGVEDLARTEGLSVLVCNTLDDSARLAEYLRLFRSRRVDALVVSGGSSLVPRDMEAIERCGLPVVLIGRPSDGSGLPYVAVDNTAAGELATCHLLDRGRSAVAHLAGPLAQTTMADRASGYRRALEERQLPPRVLETDGTAEDGYRVVVAALRSEDPPDALFAATDRLAIAALAAALDQGLCLPRDLALVGFDDLPLLASLRPSLSSMAQPARRLGEMALDLALRLAAGESVAPVLLNARLVERQSSHAPQP